MEKNLKQLIHSILTNPNKTIEEKYAEIIKDFPKYLDEMETKKAIYEKIEGIFHDGLGTYFELLVFDKIDEKYSLGNGKTNKEIVLKKMNNGITLYNKFFESNEYLVNWKDEIKNIENGVLEAIEYIDFIINGENIKKLKHSAQDFRTGNARDIYIISQSGKEFNFSLKTDKSGKVAVSEGQTPKIFEKVYNRYFNLNLEDYENIKKDLFNTTDEKTIFQDYQNVAYLTQVVMISQFGLNNCKVNNLKNAKFRNLDNLKYFIKQFKIYKNGVDNSFVVKVDRLDGKVGLETILDGIDDDKIKLDDFSMTDCKPKKGTFGTEPTIKYKGKSFVSFQVKHKRGSNASEKFQDITIRLRTK